MIKKRKMIIVKRTKEKKMIMGKMVMMIVFKIA